MPRLFAGCLCLLFVVVALAACATKKAGPVEPPPLSPIDGAKLPLIDMVLVPGGSFSMGTSRAGAIRGNEHPEHTVQIREFYLGKYELTQGQYFEITGKRPSSFVTNTENAGEDTWKDLPVEQVNWYEALVFCNLLSIKEELTPVYSINDSVNPADWGDIPDSDRKAEWNRVVMNLDAGGYRLPTEAEWEYAARGGDGSPGGFTFAGSSKADEVSWYYENSNYRIHECGKKAPNALGLYDLSGNVMEWCWDWANSYTKDPQKNPTGPLVPSGPNRGNVARVIRGGGWSVSVQYGRSTYRHENAPSYRGINLGFRAARSALPGND